MLVKIDNSWESILEKEFKAPYFQEFTNDVIIKKKSNKKQNIVFLLWGGFAKSKTKLIYPSKHHILSSGHPSPMTANRSYWFGNKHFSKTNEFLKSKNITEIEW